MIFIYLFIYTVHIKIYVVGGFLRCLSYHIICMIYLEMMLECSTLKSIAETVCRSLHILYRHIYFCSTQHIK